MTDEKNDAVLLLLFWIMFVKAALLILLDDCFLFNISCSRLEFKVEPQEVFRLINISVDIWSK